HNHHAEIPPRLLAQRVQADRQVGDAVVVWNDDINHNSGGNWQSAIGVERRYLPSAYRKLRMYSSRASCQGRSRMPSAAAATFRSGVWGGTTLSRLKSA